MQSGSGGRLPFPRHPNHFYSNSKIRFYVQSFKSGIFIHPSYPIPLIKPSLIELDIYLLGIWLFLLLFNHTSNQFKDYQYFFLSYQIYYFMFNFKNGKNEFHLPQSDNLWVLLIQMYNYIKMKRRAVHYHQTEFFLYCYKVEIIISTKDTVNIERFETFDTSSVNKKK